ncbi:MAG: pyridoxamine 5'-phosphate oxidase [Bacteroidia bacterium]|nr:pyridoxamine 5'-phosphate oxidase [Bacteroidia bacterium]
MNIADIRTDYTLKSFDEKDLLTNAFEQFEIWFDEAIKAEVLEPNAMTLATISPSGFPAARIVLLKGIEANGLEFFTNYHSNKGHDIDHNNKVALVFFWPELQRQVRVVGTAQKMSDEKSDLYFNSRPLGSRIGAHASPQSKVIPSRVLLEESVKKMEALFSEEPLLRPINWGGYVVNPISFEFWQGRSSRLHDRFIYTLQTDYNWKIERLAP